MFYRLFISCKKRKKEKIEELKYETKTIILYEAPHKLKATLELIYDILGDRKIVLARELTKIHEEFIRDNISNILKKIDEIKGEFVIIIEGSSESKKDIEKNDLKNMSLEEHYNFYEIQGLEKKK